MRLLFRHIKNSIFRTPYQMLVLLLTIVCSFVIFACVVEVQLAVKEEQRLSTVLKKGEGDILLQAGVKSNTAYLTFADAGIEEDRAASGYFTLPMQMGQDTLLAGVTDFATVDEVFDFSFVEYEECAWYQANETLFISQSLAEEQSLDVGDRVELTLMGVKKTYTVRGIHLYPFFGSYHALIHAEGALGVLSSVSPAFAVFDGDNPPCSAIYLKLKEGESLAQALTDWNERLQSFGWRATECERAESAYGWEMIHFIIVVLLILSMFIAWALVGFILRILGERRKDEMRVFWLSGMPQKKIFFAFCLEIGCYFLVGGLLGSGVSVLALRFMRSVGLQYATVACTWRGIATAILAEIAIAAFSLISYQYHSNRRKTVKEKKGTKCLFALGMSLLIIFLLGFILPVKWRIYIAGGIDVCMLLLLFFSATPYCKGIARIYTARYEKRTQNKRNPQVLLAAKNCGAVKELHNVYRILNIVLSLSLVLLVTFGYATNRVSTAKTYFNCDYIVLNARETVSASIADTAGVEGVAPAFIGEGEFLTGEKIPLVDTDIAYLSGEGEMPTGDGICMSEARAALYGYELGDKVTLTLHGEEWAFTLTGFNGKEAFYAYINADFHGFRKDTVLVKTDGSNGVFETLTEETATYGGVVSSPQTLLQNAISMTEAFNRMTGTYLLLLFVLSAVGCINFIFVSYARRKKQFADLQMVGMTKKEIRKMIAIELSFMLLSVLIISAISSVILCTAVDFGMQNFAMRLWK